jgi:hypothetical protein
MPPLLPNSIARDDGGGGRVENRTHTDEVVPSDPTVVVTDEGDDGRGRDAAVVIAVFGPESSEVGSDGVNIGIDEGAGGVGADVC